MAILSGIVVIRNRIGKNNLAGDPDTGVMPTTGVMLLSVAVPTSIVVAGNTISNNVNGVAFNSNITVVGHNRFAHVTNHYFRYTPPPRPHKGLPSPSRNRAQGPGRRFQPPGPGQSSLTIDQSRPVVA